MLDPSITYLNHAAYGATPRPVFERHVELQRELESEPVDFLSRYSTARLAASRAELAAYLGTERDNLVYVSNGTVGMNIVARSMRLTPDEEVLTTDHEHGGIDRLWRFMQQEQGFKYIRKEITLPTTTHADFVEEFWSGVTNRTRVISLSHLTSPTALVFPVKEICARARAAGIISIVDGSHVPGHLPLNLEAIGADFYVGILHKWLCAPKGCAFLYARPGMQARLNPLVVSWGWAPMNPGPSRFVDMHEWQGSRDISQFLSVSAALEFQRVNQWDAVRVRCRNLAREAQMRISDAVGLPPYHPDRPEWHGQVVCARLPRDIDPFALRASLRNEYHIDVSTDRFRGEPRIRVSIQGYNDHEDVDRLLNALKTLLSHAPVA